MQRDDALHRPGAGFVEGHVFNKTDDRAGLAGEVSKGNDLVVVETAHQHAVDLDGAKSGRLRFPDACEHTVKAAGHAGDGGKLHGVDRVHADGDAAEAGVFQWLRQAFKQVAIGGKGQVQRAAVPLVRYRHAEFIERDAQLRQLLHHLDEAAA